MTEPGEEEAWGAAVPTHTRAFDVQAATACDPDEGQSSGLGYEAAVFTDDQNVVWAAVPVDFRPGGACVAVPLGVASESFTARFSTEVAAALPRSRLVGGASSAAARVSVELVDVSEGAFGQLTVLPSVDDLFEILDQGQLFDVEGRFPLGSSLVLAYQAWVSGGVLHDEEEDEIVSDGEAALDGEDFFHGGRGRARGRRRLS